MGRELHFAFPQQPIFTDHSGMTLRDWFAGLALQGLIAGCFAGNNSGFTVEGNCKAAAEYADKLLEELAKG